MTSPSPTSQLQLHFSCRNLRNKDILSKSDPFLVLYSLLPNNQYHEVGRTEVVHNNLNPEFSKTLYVDYYFDQIQTLKIEIYDEDNTSNQLREHDFLGQYIFTVSSMVGSKMQKVFPLCGKDNKPTTNLGTTYGHIKINVDEVPICQDAAVFQFAALKLDNTDGFFGKSDPFVEIYKTGEDNTYIKVWTSEVIKNNLSPTWNRASLSLQTLCNGDYNKPLLIKVMDWESNGNNQDIGSFKTSVGQLRECFGTSIEFDLINEKKAEKKGKKYTNSGKFIVKSYQIKKAYSFLDYLKGGCQIGLIVGIDYTASNGDPSLSSSLHYMGGPYMNQYQQAIHLVGTVLQDYDYDKKFPVYGFGGVVNGATNHCFPLTFDPSNTEVFGVNGIMQAYLNSFQFVQLHGPTFFAPLIRVAATTASRFISQSPQQYFVLLIITDGAIMDMNDTVHEIVQASSYALSIVIVGVGNADFSSMNVLDGDGKFLKSPFSGVVATRDIVQFVPLNQFAQNPAMLSSEILREIPKQLIQFMDSRNLVPNSPLLGESFNDTSTKNVPSQV